MFASVARAFPRSRRDHRAGPGASAQRADARHAEFRQGRPAAEVGRGERLPPRPHIAARKAFVTVKILYTYNAKKKNLLVKNVIVYSVSCKTSG